MVPATPFPPGCMGTEVRGRDRVSSREPGRSDGSQRLDAVHLRESLGALTPGVRGRTGLPQPRGPGEAASEDEPRRLRCGSLRSALRGERLEPVADSLDAASSTAICGRSLMAPAPTLEVDETALAEVDRGEVSELTSEDIREVGMTVAVCCDPNCRDMLASAGPPNLASRYDSPAKSDLVDRVPPRPALVSTDGFIRVASLVAVKFRTSCYVDLCHGDNRADCLRAEQVRAKRARLVPCRKQEAVCCRGGATPPAWYSGASHMPWMPALRTGSRLTKQGPYVSPKHRSGRNTGRLGRVE